MIPRVGLFGGTFDPIHNGHLRLAEMAEKECGLQRILFLPAAFPPHKSPSQLTSFHHRVEMLRLALEGRKGFDCSHIEAKLPAPSYTLDTVRFLKSSLEKDTKLFFLIGIDAFCEICTWKDYDALLRTVSFVVSERNGTITEDKNKLAQELKYSRKEHLWTSNDGKQEIYFLQQHPLAISSSAIRKALQAGASVVDMIPAPVHEYIVQHRLYRLK